MTCRPNDQPAFIYRHHCCHRPHCCHCCHPLTAAIAVFSQNGPVISAPPLSWFAITKAGPVVLQTMAQLNLFQTQRDNSSENIPLRGQNDASNARKVSGRISLLSGLIRKFSVNHQVLRLFGKQFLRWVPTAFLALAIIGTLKIYENKGNMRSTDKATFNVIILILSLLLGLNFFVSHPTYSFRRRLWHLITNCLGSVQRSSKNPTMAYSSAQALE